jgi:ligand-binding sensor domain-containing protein
MNSSGSNLISLILVSVSCLAVILLIIGFRMELGEQRKEACARHPDMERTGGWRASAGGLWITVLGSGAGAACAFLLQEPLTRLVVDIFINHSGMPSLASWVSANPLVLIAPLLLLAVGPLCAGLVGPRTRTGCMACGGLSGAAAGGTLSALLLQNIASIFAQADWFNLALSATPYQEIDWIHALGLAVNNTFPWVYGTFLIVTAVCAIVGAFLGGLLPPDDPDRRRINWAAPLAIAATPLLLVSAIINVVILALMGPAVQRILDQTGTIPAFSPNWIVIPGYAIAVLAVLALQFLALASTRKGRLPTNQCWMVATGMAGLGLLQVGFALLMMSGNFYGLPFLFMGLEMVIEARRLVALKRAAPVQPLPDAATDPFATPGDASLFMNTAPAATQRSRPKALLPHWGAAGLASGLLVGLCVQLLPSTSLAVVLVNVQMLPNLADLKVPAIDPAAAEKIIRDMLMVSSAAGLATLVGAMFLGLIAGLLLQWTQNIFFLPITWVWLARLGSGWIRSAGPTAMRWLSVLGGLLAGSLIFKLTISPTSLALIAGLLALWFVSAHAEEAPPERWPRWSVAACFLIGAAGFIAQMLSQVTSLPVSLLAWRAVYALLVGPALGCALFHLLASLRPARRPWLRLGALLALAVLGSLSSRTMHTMIGLPELNARVYSIASADYVSKGLEAADFKPVNFAPHPVGEGIVFYFYTDQQGNFWLTSQAGLWLKRMPPGWQPYLFGSTNSEELKYPNSRLMEQSFPPYLIENTDGTFWTVTHSQPGLFRPTEQKDMFSIPHHLVDNTEDKTKDPTPVKVPHLEGVTGMVFQPAGKPVETLWMASLGRGLLRVEANRPLDDARWTLYDPSNSGLRSSDLYSVLVDQRGSLWAASSAGIDRLSGSTWQVMDGPGLQGSLGYNSLFEDALGRVWVATDQGGARWSGTAWQTFSVDPGWPGNLEVKRLFQDLDGHIWAGTSQGALRFDGSRWEWIDHGKAISAFAQGPDGSIWMGGEEQAARYSAGGTVQHISLADLGMPDGYVMDIYAEPDGRVWLSLSTLRGWQPGVWDLPVATGVLFALGLAITLLSTSVHLGKRTGTSRKPADDRPAPSP